MSRFLRQTAVHAQTLVTLVWRGDGVLSDSVFDCTLVLQVMTHTQVSSKSTGRHKCLALYTHITAR